MHSVKGLFKDGVIIPEEAVSGRDGQKVLITFLDDGMAAGATSEELQTLEAVVARIQAMGPNPDNIVGPTASLAKLLVNSPKAEPIDEIEWNRQWAIVEGEMKKRDLADDRAEERP